MEIANETQGVTLLQRQVDHFVRLATIFQRHHCAIDTSPTGSGKSFTAAALAIHFGFQRVLIVCPKSVKVSWEEVVASTGIPVVGLFTYQMLRGMAGKTLSHPYLTRHDRAGEAALFAPTDALRTLINEGTLIIFDEVQNIKNKSDKMRATKAIISLLLGTTTGTSRALMLSGSPFDKEEHSTNFMRAMGFIRHRQLYSVNPATKDVVLHGAQELIDVCERLDPERTGAVVRGLTLNKRTIPTLCFNLFCEVIKRHMISEMPPPDLNMEKDVKDGYYHTDHPETLAAAIGMLSRAARFREKDGVVEETNFSAITPALVRIEMAKADIFIRLARTRLERDPHCRVILFLNYNDTIEVVKRGLLQYEPLMLIGSSSDAQRRRIIHAFQAEERRLLISNTQVGGIGLNLQDLMGGRKRYVFGSPTYSAIDMHQAVGRVYREGTLTQPEIRWVYGEVTKLEASILGALARKRAVLEKVLTEQVARGEKFPGGYPEVHVPLAEE